MQRPAPAPPPQPAASPSPGAATHLATPAPAPASPPRVVPPAHVPANASPAELWLAAQKRLADRPSFVFLRHLRPVGLEGDTLVLAIAPGQREVQHVATPPRLEVVAQVVTELRGSRTRIELRTDADPASAPADADNDNPPPPPRPGQLDRRAALRLPLVRVAMQAFPDAMLIDAREEGEPDPNAPADDEPAPPAAANTPLDPLDADPDPEPEDEDD